MPKCESKVNQTMTTLPIAANEKINHNATKLRKTPEQAYFNSYDFDAIEVLPLDENDESNPVAKIDKITVAAESVSTVKVPENNSNYHRTLDRETSNNYLQKLSPYFQSVNFNKKRLGEQGITQNRNLEEDECRSNCYSSSSSSLTGDFSSSLCRSTQETYTSKNFLLPRAMLKYQSSPVPGNLIPSAISCLDQITTATETTASDCADINAYTSLTMIGNHINVPVNCGGGTSFARGASQCITSTTTTTTTPAAITKEKIATTAEILNNSGLVQQCCRDEKMIEPERGGCGGRGNNMVCHYSTDKSGSSGYYSSNLCCSASSVEEHIYCEPIIDSIIETSIQPKLNTLSRILFKADLSVMKESSNNGKQSALTDDCSKMNNLNEDLRLLETSIENLDRHLKSYSKHMNYCNQQQQHKCSSQGSRYCFDKTKIPQLPTIMEGIDGQSVKQTANSWSEDMDDSLMDIDLDSFLLDNAENSPVNIDQLNGINNPGFENTQVLDDKNLENNYRCSKYINSCPDDAYRVENVLYAESEKKSLDFFLKKYEDQLHFQNTKDMLEEIRDKLKILAQACTRGDKIISNELENNIASLKVDLEAYLRLMNQRNEIEIKNFCTGVLNNQKLLTITKAFERRKSLVSEEYNNETTYEPIPSVRNSAIKNLSNNYSSVKCSDPNFELRRKALSEVFPINTENDRCITENVDSDKAGETDATHIKPSLNTTQLRRNLSFQRPSEFKNLRKIDEEDSDSILEWHKNKPSIWQQYYGTNRINQTLEGKRGHLIKHASSFMSYPSSRPESDFTLDLPRAEQLRLKMEKEKKFRQRCRILTTFLCLIFFLITVMVVSLVLTRGKKMFGSMI